MQFNNENMKIEYGRWNSDYQAYHATMCEFIYIQDYTGAIVIVCKDCGKCDSDAGFVWHRCWSSPQIGGRTVYNERKKILDAEYNRIVLYF